MTAKQRVVLVALRDVQHERDGEAVAAGQIAAACRSRGAAGRTSRPRRPSCSSATALVLVVTGSTRAWKITAAGRLMLPPRRGPAPQRRGVGDGPDAR